MFNPDEYIAKNKLMVEPTKETSSQFNPDEYMAKNNINVVENGKTFDPDKYLTDNNIEIPKKETNTALDIITKTITDPLAGGLIQKGMQKVPLKPAGAEDVNSLVELGKAPIQGALGMGAGAGEFGEYLANTAPIFVDKMPILNKTSGFLKTYYKGLADVSRKTSDFLKGVSDKYVPSDERITGGSWKENPSMLRGGITIAQALPSLLAGVGTGAIAQKGLNLGTKGSALASALGLSALETNFQEAKDALRVQGYNDEDASRKAVLTATANLISTTGLEYLPLEKFIGGGKGQSVFKSILEGMTSEGMTETAQQFSQNLVAKFGYDKARDLTTGLIDSFIGGAGSGGIVGGLTANVGKPKVQPQQNITPVQPAQEITDTNKRELQIPNTETLREQNLPPAVPQQQPVTEQPQIIDTGTELENKTDEQLLKEIDYIDNFLNINKDAESDNKSKLSSNEILSWNFLRNQATEELNKRAANKKINLKEDIKDLTANFTSGISADNLNWLERIKNKIETSTPDKVNLIERKVNQIRYEAENAYEAAQNSFEQLQKKDMYGTKKTKLSYMTDSVKDMGITKIFAPEPNHAMYGEYKNLPPVIKQKFFTKDASRKDIAMKYDEAEQILQEHGYNGDLWSYFGDIYRSANKNYQTKYRTNEPIEINQNDIEQIGNYNNIEELRKNAIDFYKNNLQNKSVDNGNYKNIRITKKSRQRYKTYSADERKLLIVPKLLKIIETAEYVRSQNIYKNRKDNIIKFHYFKNKVVLKNEPYEIFISIAEDRKGNLFYDLDENKSSLRKLPGLQSPGFQESNNNVIQKNINVKPFRLSEQNIDDIKALNQKLFGDENIEIFDQILTESGKEALGQYYNGMIAIMNGRADYKDTYYHEAVHKYLNLFATNSERKAIFAYFTQNSISRKYADIEETIAENFIQYAKSREGLTGKIKLFFDRILLRIQNFFGNYDLVKELYGDILQGKARKITEEASQVKKETYEPVFERKFKEVSPADINTPEFKKWFGDSKVVDENGKPLVVYHGSKRVDRIGNVFDPQRATSGPMAYFTTDPEIASNYANNKEDTSNQKNGYEDWFLFQKNNKDLNLIEYGKTLSEQENQKILQKLKAIDIDENDNIFYKKNHKTEIAPNDYIDYLYKYEAKRNALDLAQKLWLDSGNLYDIEEKFFDVLKYIGITNVKKDFPSDIAAGVYPVYLSIKNPLNTLNIPKEVLKKLEASSKRKESQPKYSGYGVDTWDKNTKDPKEWIQSLKADMQNKVNSFVWTSIPDWVTKTLIKDGYDGIQDIGNKATNGKDHYVWIPFSSTQIKSINNQGTFDINNPDIRYRIEDKTKIPNGIKELSQDEINSMLADNTAEEKKELFDYIDNQIKKGLTYDEIIKASREDRENFGITRIVTQGQFERFVKNIKDDSRKIIDLIEPIQQKKQADILEPFTKDASQTQQQPPKKWHSNDFNMNGGRYTLVKQTRNMPTDILDALRDNKLTDLSTRQAGQLSTLAPTRACEVVDGKRFGIFKEKFLLPIQEADKNFNMELKQQKAEAEKMFRGLDKQTLQDIFNYVEHTPLTSEQIDKIFKENTAKERQDLFDYIDDLVSKTLPYDDVLKVIKNDQENFGITRIVTQEQFDKLYGHRLREKLNGKPNFDTIQRVGKWLRIKYDDFIDRLNKERAVIGKDLVHKRTNYITHLMELNAVDEILQYIGNNLTDVPASMLSISMYTKPNSPFFKFAKPRLGYKTIKDAKKSYFTYLEPVLKNIHFTRPIKNGRDILEYKVETVGEYEGNKPQKFSLFAMQMPNAYKYFTNYINSLSGKRELIDKEFQTTATILNETNKLFSAGSIGGNLSTAITQFLSSRNTVAETNVFAIKGALRMLTPSGRLFYKNNSRIGAGRSYEPAMISDRLLGSKLLGYTHKKISETASFLISFLDHLQVGTAFIAGYEQAKYMGLNEKDAIRYGDDVAERTQSSGNLVDRPPVNRGKIKVGLNQFNTFVYNEWSQLKQDMIKGIIKAEQSKQEYAKEGLGAVKANSRGKAFGRIIMYIAMTAILSNIYDAAGLPNNLKMEDDDKDENFFGVLKNYLLNSVPGLSTVRFGGSPFLKGGYNLLLYITGTENDRNKALKAMKGIGARVVPAGGQISKTWGGIQAVYNNGVVRSDKGKFLYRIDTSNIPEVARALAFGTWQTQAGKKYLEKYKK